MYISNNIFAGCILIKYLFGFCVEYKKILLNCNPQLILNRLSSDFYLIHYVWTEHLNSEVIFEYSNSSIHIWILIKIIFFGDIINCHWLKKSCVWSNKSCNFSEKPCDIAKYISPSISLITWKNSNNYYASILQIIKSKLNFIFIWFSKRFFLQHCILSIWNFKISE